MRRIIPSQLAHYPMNDNVKLLKDNRSQAIARQTSVEKGLKKMGRTDEYNKCFQDILDRGAMVPVTDEELKKHKEAGGVVNYTEHHPVFKETSLSTPLRIVNDSAMKNSWTGPSFNDCSSKGPKALNNLVKILLKWRTYQVAIILDLKKAYNSIKTGEFEKYLRLQVWRFGMEQEDWSTFAYVCVAFGDVIASLVLEIAKQLCAEKAEGKELDPEAIKRILEDFYVDDGISGCDTNIVAQLVGNCTIT